jgi:hypothetical protein
MIVYGKCIRKTVGFTEGRHYSFKKLIEEVAFPEDEYLSDIDIEFYVANDRGRIMAITSEFFDKHFEMTSVEA